MLTLAPPPTPNPMPMLTLTLVPVLVRVLVRMRMLRPKAKCGCECEFECECEAAGSGLLASSLCVHGRWLPALGCWPPLSVCILFLSRRGSDEGAGLDPFNLRLMLGSAWVGLSVDPAFSILARILRLFFFAKNDDLVRISMDSRLVCGSWLLAAGSFLMACSSDRRHSHPEK